MQINRLSNFPIINSLYDSSILTNEEKKDKFRGKSFHSVGNSQTRSRQKSNKIIQFKVKVILHKKSNMYLYHVHDRISMFKK